MAAAAAGAAAGAMRPPWSHEREWKRRRRRPSPSTSEARGRPTWKRDSLGPQRAQDDKLRYMNGQGCQIDHKRNRVPSISMPVIKYETPNCCNTACMSDQFERHVMGQTNCYDTLCVSENFQRHVTDQGFSSNRSVNPDKRARRWRISPGRGLLSQMQKKLLVLDINGLLADAVCDYKNTLNARTRINGKAVFKRPFCEDFLKFCLERFEVGIWSSKKQKNVDEMVNYLVGDMRRNLLFCWDQSKCTFTGFRTVDNMQKPLVLKELKKLWNKEEHGLPWRRGFYTASNTLLLDDSPYKALCNPPHTAVFPYAYKFTDEHDYSLGPQGEIRIYLEGLAMANDVQDYVKAHPFGQRPITSKNPSWKLYRRIIDQFQYSSIAG